MIKAMFCPDHGIIMARSLHGSHVFPGIPKTSQSGSSWRRPLGYEYFWYMRNILLSPVEVPEKISTDQRWSRAFQRCFSLNQRCSVLLFVVWKYNFGHWTALTQFWFCLKLLWVSHMYGRSSECDKKCRATMKLLLSKFLLSALFWGF